MARVEKTLTDELADAAIHELFVRAGQRPPQGGRDYMWSQEGPRRVRDLDTIKDWMAGR